MDHTSNRVRRGKTLLSNVAQGAHALPAQIRAYFDLVQDFRPEVVISVPSFDADIADVPGLARIGEVLFAQDPTGTIPS